MIWFLKVFGLPGSIALGAAVLLLVAFGVQTWRLDGAQDTIAERDLASAKAAEEAALAGLAHVEALRKAEAAYAKSLLVVAEELQKENQDAKAQVDRLLAGLADGTERLRARFRCPTAIAGVPGDPAVAGGDPAGEAGFGPADARVAFGIAGDGDGAARGLNACIDAYNAIRTR